MPKIQCNCVEMFDAALEYVENLETTWDATVFFRIERDGTNYAKTCNVRVVACVPVFEGAGRTKRVEKVGKWPSNSYKSVGALLYHLCHQVDQEIGSTLHKQLALPFEPAGV